MEIMHRLCCDYSHKKNYWKKIFNFGLALDELIIYHNNTKYTFTKDKPADIRDFQD